MSQGAVIGNLLIFALPVLLIVWMVSSQRKRQRQVQQVQGSLTIGDDVVTTAGLFGRIVQLDESSAALDVGNGVVLTFDRRALAGPAPQGSAVPPSSQPSQPAPQPKSTPQEATQQPMQSTQPTHEPAAPQDAPPAARGDEA